MQERLLMHSEQELILLQFLSTLAVANAVRNTDASCNIEKVPNIVLGEENSVVTLNGRYTCLVAL